MKKSLFIILMVCLAIVGLVSCKNEIEPAQEELISVSFENGTSRALTATLEEFDMDEFYWSYEAQKNDGSGLRSGETAWDTTGEGSVAVQSGKGLDDANDNPVKVPGFSKGYWNFRLFAYADADRQNLVYWGEADLVLIDSTHHEAKVTVNPVSGGNGYLKIGTITFVPASGISVPTDLVVYTDELFKLEGDEWVKVTTQPEGGIYTLPAKQYKFSRTYSFDGIPVANGSVIVTIYSNLTTTVSGTLSELTTYAEFKGEQNPDIVRETWGTASIDEDTTGTINFTKNIDPTATEKVTSATMPAAAAVAKLTELSQAVGADETSSSSLKLNLNVDTTEVKQQSVTYDIGMEAVLTYTKNQTQSVAKSDVKNVADYVIVVIDIDSDISDVSVTHSGKNMIKYTDYDQFLAADVYDDVLVPATATSEAFYKGFYCLRTDGEARTLNIKTRSFSPFEVTYAMTKYVAAIGNDKYTTLTDAIAAAKPGDTIVILDNITTNDGYLVAKNLNINTNGYTITVNEGASINNRAFRIDSGKLSVYGGGKIVAVGSGTTSSDGAGCYGAFRVEAAGELVVSNMTLQNSRPWGLNVKVCGGKAELTNVTINSSYGGGIEVTEKKLGEHSQVGSATLTDCTFTQTGYFDHCSTTLSVSGGSELIVNGGSYTSDNYALYVFSSGGVITVKDGTFSGNKDGVAIIAAIDTSTYPQYTGGLAISGGLFAGGYNITSPAYMVITGGTYDHDPTAYVPATGYRVEHDEKTGKWTVLKNDDYVATVTSGTATTGYYSLEEAFANTVSGDTVTLLKNVFVGDTIDIAAEKAITLDLNGNKIDAAGTTLKVEDKPIFNNAGNLTINGETAGSAINAEATVAFGAEGSTLTVNGGSYSNSFAGSQVFDTKGEATIENVILTGVVKGIRADGTNAKVTVSNSMADVSPSYGLFAVKNGGNLTVSGGSYRTTYKDQLQMIDIKAGTVTIEGGSFETVYTKTDDAPALVVINTSGANLKIEGGTFKYSGALVYDHYVGKDNFTVSITGGTYSKNPNENPAKTYVADGYMSVAQGTTPETWVVVKADVQVQAGTETVAYMTLEQFRDDVNAGTSYAGKTVTLLGNVDLKNNEWTPIGTEDHPFNGVFDGNGKTISNLKVTETGLFSGLFGVVCGSAANAQFDEIGDVFDLSTNTLAADLDSKIAAGNYSAVIKNLTIDGFTVDCWIDGVDNEANARYSGALVGSAQYAYIGNCDVTNGTVTGCKAFGGEIGRIDGSAVVDCSTSSTVSVIAKANLVGEEAGAFNFGGIVGATSYKFSSNYGRSIVKDCTNNARLVKVDGEAKGCIAGVVGFGQNGGYQTPSIIVGCAHNGIIECSVSGADLSVAGIAAGCVNVLYFVDCANTDALNNVTGTVGQNAGIASAPSSNNHNWRAINCNSCVITNPTHTEKRNQILNCVNDVKTLVNCTYGTESGINYPEA